MRLFTWYFDESTQTKLNKPKRSAQGSIQSADKMNRAARKKHERNEQYIMIMNNKI